LIIDLNLEKELDSELLIKFGIMNKNFVFEIFGRVRVLTIFSSSTHSIFTMKTIN